MNNLLQSSERGKTADAFKEPDVLVNTCKTELKPSGLNALPLGRCDTAFSISSVDIADSNGGLFPSEGHGGFKFLPEITPGFKSDSFQCERKCK